MNQLLTLWHLLLLSELVSGRKFKSFDTKLTNSFKWSKLDQVLKFPLSIAFNSFLFIYSTGSFKYQSTCKDSKNSASILILLSHWRLLLPKWIFVNNSMGCTFAWHSFLLTERHSQLHVFFMKPSQGTINCITRRWKSKTRERENTINNNLSESHT